MNFSNELNYCEVQKWVKDLFKDTYIDIPESINKKECLKLMSNIISVNKESDKDAQEIIKAELNLADCYTMKDADLCNSIASEDLGDLSPDVLENIRKVASLSVQMKLKEPTITNFLLCSAMLNNKKEEHIEQEIRNAFTLSKLSKKMTDVMQQNAVLERKIETLETVVSKQQNVNLQIQDLYKFIKIKADEYQRRIEKTERKLRNFGWNSSLSHSELVKRAEVIQCLEEKVNNLSSKLENYENLPPNEMLTRLKVEEAEAEILRLNKEFDNMLKILY